MLYFIPCERRDGHDSPCIRACRSPVDPRYIKSEPTLARIVRRMQPRSLNTEKCRGYEFVRACLAAW